MKRKGIFIATFFSNLHVVFSDGFASLFCCMHLHSADIIYITQVYLHQILKRILPFHSFCIFCLISIHFFFTIDFITMNLLSSLTTKKQHDCKIHIYIYIYECIIRNTMHDLVIVYNDSICRWLIEYGVKSSMSQKCDIYIYKRGFLSSSFQEINNSQSPCNPSC